VAATPRRRWVWGGGLWWPHDVGCHSHVMWGGELWRPCHVEDGCGRWAVQPHDVGGGLVVARRCSVGTQRHALSHQGWQTDE